jgi:hypothetical protein
MRMLLRLTSAEVNDKKVEWQEKNQMNIFYTEEGVGYI